MENRATITVDKVIMNLLQNPPAMPGLTLGYAAVVGQLWERLVDKGDDPRYQRLVLAPDPFHFRIIDERAVDLTGVFARYSAVPYSDDRHSTVLKNIFGPQRESTLVVVPDVITENYWQNQLNELRYSIRKI